MNTVTQSTQSSNSLVEDYLIESLGEEWYYLLNEEFKKEYMVNLMTFIRNRRKETTVYPPQGSVFNAYKYTPYSKIRVVIIGQDPYINEFEAEGIAFSTMNGQYTPSLSQIGRAVWKQIYDSDKTYTWDNRLKRWCDQGIFLLNTVLTVDKGASGSHKGKGWETFTTKTIELIDNKKDVLFLLWGNDAKIFRNHIKNNTFIECEHPQAANYAKRDWNNNDCFNKINNIINGNKIKW